MLKNSWVCGFAVLCAMMACSLETRAAEELPAGAQVVSLTAQPAAVELSHRYQYRQLLLTGKLASGETFDATRMAQLAAPSNLVDVSAARLVRPKKDGSDTLKFTLAGQTVEVPVKVSGQTADYEVSFIRDVLPDMSKLGCNAGTCHGGAQGKNGFKLSLRGYDAIFDHLSLTDDLASRRFNRASPEMSLMLLKPIGATPHVGGVLMKPGETSYNILRDWIAQGAKLDRDSPRVVKISVTPHNPVIPREGMKQQMAVTATYSDGTTRDVSAEAFVESGNIEVAEADKFGVVTALRRGEAPVLVRYEGAYTATTFTVMGDRSGFTWQAPPENNYIDTLVYAKLQRMKTQPSDLCTDAEFIRRVYLDLTGLLPSATEVRQFLADSRDTKIKRDALIEKLVGSAEYVEHWTNKWADLLQVNAKFLGEEGSWALRNWIKQAVASNMPYDQFVREVLTAQGSNLENPPASYYKILREPDLVMENTTQLFLGVRFSCNKCHDHPFERWTQNQHWQLAAFFSGVHRKADPKYADKKIGGSAVEGALPMVEVVYDGNAMPVKHPNTNLAQPAKFPYEHAEMPPANAPLRAQFAAWATSPKNEYFAKSFVNRTWSYLLGVGFIEPVDDIRAGNPPTNPELLDRLTNDFIAQNFNVQWLLKSICQSRTYQHSIATNEWDEDDTTNFSHALARRLPAEVLYDAVYQATGSQRRLPGMPANARAAEQRDSTVNLPDGFLDLFGRPARQSACECERSGGVMMGQMLNLINGPTIAAAISDAAGDLPKLLAQHKDDAEIVRELYLRFLSRPASESEVAAGVAAIRSFADETAEIQNRIAAYEKSLPEKQFAWEAEIGKPIAWQPLTLGEGSSKAGAKFAQEDDHVIFVTGPLAKDTYTLKLPTELKTLTGIRLEVLADDRLPGKGPGRADNGNFVLNELTLAVAAKPGEKKPQKIVLQNAAADFSQKNYSVVGAIDGDVATGWAVMPTGGKTVGVSLTATFETTADIVLADDATLVLTLDQQYADGKHLLGKFRVSATDSKRPLSANNLPAGLAKILALPVAERSETQLRELADYFADHDAGLAALRAELKQAEAQRPQARLLGTQDLVWALINNAAFLFNR